jgi:DNA-binding NarL/FixJ family response regulator
MESPSIQLAIADDHCAVRQAFRKALESYNFIEVIFEAENGEELLSKICKREPQVVLLDIKMSIMNGIEALKVIHHKYPAIRILVLSAYLDEVFVCECLKLGINGYLSKNMEISEIVMAIKAASNNEMYFTNLISIFYFRNYIANHNKTSRHLLPLFSVEEIKIAELIRQERTTEEIADICCLSKRSIEIKREKMKEKANVRSTVGLLLYLIKRGLIE